MVSEMLRRVRRIADYQFGEGAGEALFPDNCEFILSSTGKIRQILEEGKRIATLRAECGLLTLSIYGARKLHSKIPPPRLRVFVNSEAAPFVADGKNVFSKHVLRCDENIRALDEVLVVDEDDRLLATGRAVLSSCEMGVFKRGMAVSVRESIKKEV
ncbi:MAG: hypothetical protein PWR13_706 [Archaeoglobi archaeon]|nr:hypothetical protein [Archaeoglobi archaeon]MDK2781678.1 hypothetical protein [Archaeoglobi archaeon]